MLDRPNDTAIIRCNDGIGRVKIGTDALTEAIFRWRRGEKREALHHLENALDGNFDGLGELRPEDIRP